MQIINQIKKIKVVIFSFAIILLSIFFVFFKLSTAQICSAPPYLLWSGSWQQNRVPISSSTTYYLTIDNSPIYVSGDKVGISVINPIYDLQVNGTISANEFCITSNTGFASCVNSWATGTVIVSGNPSPGQVAFWTGPSTISGDNNFFWSTSTNRLGINTTTPQTALHVATSVMSNEFKGKINAENISAGTFGGGNYYFMGNLVIGTTTPQRSLHATQYITSNTGFCIKDDCIANNFNILQAGYWNLINSILYASSTSWNVAIGTTTIDPTYKLQVAGGSVGITNSGLVIGNTPQRGNWNSRVPLNNVITTVDNSATGTYASITIAPDGLPIIAYYYASNSLRVAKCNDLFCSDRTINTVDSSGNVGQYTSITIATDSLPIISYYGTSTLRVAKCNDIYCSTRTINTVDSSGNVGKYTSIAIPTIVTDTAPIISYYGTSTLRVAKCNDIYCSTRTINTVDSSGNVGQYTSITIGSDALPIISYYDATNTDLKIAKCQNILCTSRNIVRVTSSNIDGLETSITIAPDGLPIIAYRDVTANTVKVLKCGTLNCSLIASDFGIASGSLPSIAIGSDGLPIVAYTGNDGKLKVVKCGSEFCVPYWTRR